MACSGGDVGGRLPVLVITGAAFGGTRLVPIGGNFGSGNTSGHIEPSRAVQHRSDFNVYRERTNNVCHGRFTGFSDSRFAAPSQYAPSAAARGRGALVHKCFGVRAVVLEVGRGRSADAGGKARTIGKLIPFSANAGRGWRRSVLVTAFRGLLISCLQHEHGFFAYRHGCAFALGQSGDDAAVVDFVDDHCAACRSRGKYFVSRAASRLEPG